MDKSVIKSQIAYWEAQLKDGEKLVKVQQEQNATIKATIKSLKALLPKEKEEDVVEFNPGDPN